MTAQTVPWPLDGLVRRPRARLLLQILLLLVAAAIVAHGLLGPQIAPRNLATVLTWVHYRGLLVLALLAVGNLFCMGCPLVLARDGARRFVHLGLRWPRRLRGKWMGVALFGAVLFTYELFDLWALPAATAWLVVGYFAAVLLVDTIFSGATFCKHLCPVGQFNFAASLISPTELRVRDAGTCTSCRTSDCIRGRRDAAVPARVVRRGCELGIFLPAKVGNMDCTLCLDCVRACPHDNVVLGTRLPGAELLDTRRRSGVGHLAARPDVAALALLFTFGALLNAFAMTAPVHDLHGWMAATFAIESEAAMLAVLFLAGLVVMPLALVGGAASIARRLAPVSAPVGALALRYVYALLPLGFSVWLAHYGFHLLTGAFTVVPVAQSAAIDLAGRAVLGAPLWTWAGLDPGAVYVLQLGCIVLGTAGSAAVAHGMSVADHPTAPGAASAAWVALIVLLGVAAVWILSQPMDMRGVTFA